MRKRTHGFQRGDVVVVPVVFAAPAGSKIRPALVISSNAYHRAQLVNVLIIAISGNVAGHQTATDYTLKDWQASGLQRPSVVTSFITTVAPSDIRHTIGRLSTNDLREVDKRLRLSLDLS
ncbi:MAG: type II toxin-antitoxin system PemK/MazF family toxin [Deltaproteobacteria bacterium]|nr:type II toxin-antitoxin system PemK/MazF family toxin [Deltaproteobacteria bacterium]